jgi:hypothetical protein
MHSLKRLFALVAFLTCCICHAQESPNVASHCKQGESAYLNANMPELRYPQYETEEERKTKPVWILRKTGKILSICTDRVSEPFNYITYRFGAIGNIEFERVATKSAPFYVFERSTSPHTGEFVLFFSVGPHTYCVSEATGQGSGISLTVLKAGAEVASFFSGNHHGTDYEVNLVDISSSPSLRKYPLKDKFRTPCDGKRLMRP